MSQTQPFVTVSPEVIRTLVRNTVLAMPDVRGLFGGGRRLGGRDAAAIEVQIENDASGSDGSVGVVRVSLHVVAAADVPLLKLGGEIQDEVIAVVEEIVGMRVISVDVLFEDVKA